jgi:hypothetical protein
MRFDTLKSRTGNSIAEAIGAPVLPPPLYVEPPFRDDFASPRSAAYAYDCLGFRVRWLDDNGKASQVGKNLRLVAGGLCVIRTEPELNLTRLPDWRHVRSYWIDEEQPGVRFYLAPGGVGATYEGVGFTITSFTGNVTGWAPREFIIAPGCAPNLHWGPGAEPPRRALLGHIPAQIALEMIRSQQVKQ